jgi:hypothetical protein
MAERNRFIPNGPELYALTGVTPGAARTQRCTGRGSLSSILCKFGKRLGIWLADWDALTESQRKMGQESAAAHFRESGSVGANRRAAVGSAEVAPLKIRLDGPPRD